MKNLKKQLLILIICILPAMQVQSSTVEFSAASTSIEIGEDLDIFINAVDITELVGGVLAFSISSASLTVNGVMIDDFWDFDPVEGALDRDVWRGISFDTFGDALVGNGIIAKISVTGAEAGSTTLKLLDTSDLFDTSQTPLVTSDLLNANSEITIQVVQAVPLPAAVWLMGSALIGLVGLRKKAL